MLFRLHTFPCSIHHPWVAEVHFAKSWAHSRQIATTPKRAMMKKKRQKPLNPPQCYLWMLSGRE